MDCTDMVIGMAKGNYSSVFDCYTRDRGKPQRDSFYNGVESLTAAVGMEENGFTYLKWRRPLMTGIYVYNTHHTQLFGLYRYRQKLHPWMVTCMVCSYMEVRIYVGRGTGQEGMPPPRAHTFFGHSHAKPLYF